MRMVFPMAKTPILFTGLAGGLVACLLLAAHISELGKDHSDLPQPAPRMLGSTADVEAGNDLTTRTRGLRAKRSRHVNVNYAFLEQGLQISLPKLYGNYILELDLSAYESRYFESLLIERLLAQQQFGLEFMTGGWEERILSAQVIERRITENNVKIRQFLNHREDYFDFVKYEKQLPELRNLNEIRPFLSHLSQETEEQLLNILYQCRVKAEGELPIWKTMLAIVDLETKQETWRQCDESITQLLPSLLPDEQLQDFLKHWRTAREKQKTQYGISHAILHGES